MFLSTGRCPPQIQATIDLDPLRQFGDDAAQFFALGQFLYVSQFSPDSTAQAPALPIDTSAVPLPMGGSAPSTNEPVPPQLPPPPHVQCSAYVQSKRSGRQCADPAVSSGPPLCRFHLLLAHVESQPCAAISRTNRPCTHKRVAGLETCPFHTDDTSFSRFLAGLSAEVPAAPIVDGDLPIDTTELQATRTDLTPMLPTEGFVQALSSLEDPDLEDDLLLSAEVWLAEASSFVPPAHVAAPITFTQLRSYLMTRGAPGHPLSLLPWKRATLLGHSRTIEKICADTTPGIQALPLVKGLLEHLLRRKQKRRWRWTTTIRAFAEVQGALKNLDVSRGIPALHLARSSEWTAAIKGVAARARSELPRTPISASASQVLAAMLAEPHRGTRLLLALTWLCCGRTGDIRQLNPTDISVSPGEKTILTVTFRNGKTIERRGPFSLHTVLPHGWITHLGFAQSKDVANTALWVPLLRSASTATVLKALRRVNDRLENRSLRRGALQSLAAASVPESTLLEFSGHTTISMLRRYLAWGSIGTHKQTLMSHAAAALDAPAVPAGGSLADPILPTKHLQHHSSQRWLQFIGVESPPSSELPQSTNHLHRDASRLPLMSKAVAATINTKLAEEAIQDPQLKQLCHESFRWLYDPSRYESLLAQAPTHRRGSTAPVRKYAKSSLSKEDHEIQVSLHKYEKIEKMHQHAVEVAAWVRVFSVPQWNKDPPNRRHIGEPTTNDWFRATPTVAFRSRAERHRIISNFRGGFAASLDLSSFFDQFRLGKRIRKFFGIRCGREITRFAVLPMGFRPSAQIAQCFTWALLEQLGNDTDSAVLSYIDNILIVAKTKEEVRRIRTEILNRAKTFGAIFNQEGINDDPSHKFEFLGEAFDLGVDNSKPVSRSLSKKTITKLSLLDLDWLFPLTAGPPPPITVRQLAAVVGLSLFASGSGLPDNDIWKRQAALRFYRDQLRFDTGSRHMWDQPITPMPASVQIAFRTWISELRLNTPHSIIPMTNGEPRDVIFTDASAVGWGAVHLDHVGALHVRQGQWSADDHQRWNLSSSVNSEPLAIQRALCTCITPGPSSNVLVYTDHEPLKSAMLADCAKTWAYWDLQKTIKTFPGQIRIQFVRGELNPADRFSRSFPATPLEPWEFCNVVSLHAFQQQHQLEQRFEHNEHGVTGPGPEAEWEQTARNPYRMIVPPGPTAG